MKVETDAAFNRFLEVRKDDVEVTSTGKVVPCASASDKEGEMSSLLARIDNDNSFYRMTRAHSSDYCSMSVCPFVRLFVTCQCCIQTTEHIVDIFAPHCAK